MRTLLLALIVFSPMVLSAQLLELGVFKFDTYRNASTSHYTSMYDFSTLFSDSHSYYDLGFIGDNYQRIRIKFISVIRNSNQPEEYFIYGKSNVLDNICDFQGLITITEVKIVEDMHYGVDDIWQDSMIVEQGVIIATYHLFENPSQKHVGVFKGNLISGWYRKDDNTIIYDNIEWQSDRWCNNQFVGTWTEYQKNISKKCNWGDSRIPGTSRTLDIGGPYFWPSDEYHKQGWANYAKAWDFPEWDERARELEQKKWWE